MCGAFTRGLLKSENSTASNAGKEKQKREAPRKASPHSEENPGKSRKMNLYNQQCHPEQAGPRSTYPGPERHMKGCVPRPRIWFQGSGDSGVSHLRQCVSKTIYCHSVAPQQARATTDPEGANMARSSLVPSEDRMSIAQHRVYTAQSRIQRVIRTAIVKGQIS